MEPTTLQLIWFVLIGVLLAGYAILDGFDLGVGILHPGARNDTERRIFMNAIGPLWDGNEVWLVVFGGALFAAFPNAYAAAFSGFYTGFMLLLACLIFRGVSMEFRSKREERWWRGAWDASFWAASTLATFLYGVVVGNCVRGLPLGADGDFDRSVSVLDLLSPYATLVGLFAVATFALHGAIYLYLKTEAELQRRVRRWIWGAFAAFLVLYGLVTAATLAGHPGAVARFRDYPWAWLVVGLNVLAVANIPRALVQGRPLYAFVSSSCTIAAFTFLFGMALFPNMIVSTVDPAYDLTVARAASTEKTLGVMLVMAGLGMPFVLGYTASVYWVFRGKVEVGKFTY